MRVKALVELHGMKKPEAVILVNKEMRQERATKQADEKLRSVEPKQRTMIEDQPW